MSALPTRPITHPAAWKAADYTGDDWITRLSDAELEDVDRALNHVRAAGRRHGHFGRSDFPLPRWTARLREIVETVRDGRGFVLLRGLPLQRYSLEETKTIYWGICSHLGTMAPQGGNGDLIQHVEDTSTYDLADPNRRANSTGEALSPHSDFGDIVGLLCVGKAAEGGASSVISSVSLFNETVRRHPEYLTLLSREFYEVTNLRYDDPTRDPLKSVSPEGVPIVSFTGGRLAVTMRRRLMQKGMDRRNTPISDDEMRAMLFLEEVANGDSYRLDMDLQPGDIQLINNYTTFHARTAFRDDPGRGLKRLLLRIWINLDEPMPLQQNVAIHMRRGYPIHAG
ncbi:MAG: TauD/TfdA family dioxygenase [Lautropia sp.]